MEGTIQVNFKLWSPARSARFELNPSGLEIRKWRILRVLQLEPFPLKNGPYLLSVFLMCELSHPEKKSRMGRSGIASSLE